MLCVFVLLSVEYSSPFYSLENLYRFGHSQRDYVEERHRHRYEVNPNVVEEVEKAGMKFVGHSTDDQRMEIMELKGAGLCDMYV